MILVAGIGWVTGNRYGYIRQGLCQHYENANSLRSELQEKSVFSYPVQNFGRFDPVSKITCCAAALALHDAGVPYSRDQKQDIGIIGTNTTGSLFSNLRYFEDYVEAGRKLARGNLFIYTLPSSPLAEAAIYFRFQGPLLYVMFPGHPLAVLLRSAGAMIDRGEASGMLAVRAAEKEAVCFVLLRGKDMPLGCVGGLDDVMKMSKTAFQVEEIVNECMK